MENLLINRYLDEDERFYKTTEATLRFLENLQLHGPWLSVMSETDRKTALEWYLGRWGKTTSRAFQIWIDLLNKVYHKLIKSMQTMISETGFKTLRELRSSYDDLDKAFGGIIEF